MSAFPWYLSNSYWNFTTANNDIGSLKANILVEIVSKLVPATARSNPKLSTLDDFDRKGPEFDDFWTGTQVLENKNTIVLQQKTGNIDTMI